ncbi:MAG: tRNA (guanosine(37)-N1)-methyltransferase TrmD, partial [Acholeplasmataceae bacterium]|nr:tRNA (guanosine(37)-N1)-methyltransferase TrmD [Acholeplasmataceae bacterium]
HQNESFEENLLEHPHYTKPQDYQGYKVPEVLVSGHHEKIRKWRRYMSLKETYYKRPDLLKKAKLTKEDEIFLEMIKAKKTLDI